MTAPKKVCLDAYASVRAFRSDEGNVDDVTWSILVPGVATPVTINASGTASTPGIFRYIGAKQQSLTIDLKAVGTYQLTATVIRGSNSWSITKAIVVEDCRMEVCQGQFTPSTNFIETFGFFPAGDEQRRFVDPAVATIEYNFQGDESQALGDNWYSIFWNSQAGGRPEWDYVEDHTANGRGGMLIANSSHEKKTFYKRKVTGLCPGARYNFSAWFINLNSREVLDNVCQNDPNSADQYRYAGVTFIIRNATTNAIIKQFNTNDVSMDLSRPDLTAEQRRLAGWQQFGGTVALAGGEESVWVEILNNNPGGCGNDIAIDDIEFKYCAPDIYTYIDGEEVTKNQVCPGAPLSLTSVIKPAGYFTNPVYSWEIDKGDGNGWQPITSATPGYSGVNTATLQILDGTLPEKNTWLYRSMVIEAGNLATGKQCYTPSNFVTLIILEMPKLIAAGRICQGDMTKLTANYMRTPTQDGYETFEFIGLGSDVVPWPEPNAQPANEIYVRPNATTTYTVRGSASYGFEPTSGKPRVCYRTTTAEIIVDPRPVVDLGPDLKVCESTPVILDAGAANAGYSILWQPGGATTRTLNITSPATGNTTQNYEVTVTNGTCVVKDNINVTSAKTPVATITTTPTIRCSDVRVDFPLETTVQTGNTAVWSFVGDPAGATITPNPSDPNQPTLTNMPFNTDVRVRLTITADGTSCSAVAEEVFRIDQNVTATAPSITQCSPDFVMNANVPNAALGQTGKWTVVSGGTNVFIDPADINNPAAPVKLLNGITSASIRWTVSPRPGSACGTRSQLATLSVLPPPVMTAANLSRCLGTPMVFTVPFTQSGLPTRYDLEAITPLSGFTDRINATVSGTSFTIPYDAGATPGTYTFRLKARKTAGSGVCETISTFDLTILAPSTAPTVNNATLQICRGASTDLTVNGTLGTGAQWVWYTGGCTGGTQVGTGATISVSPTVTTTYYVKAVSAGPCGNTACATITVNVFEQPSTAAAGPDQEHCNVSSFVLAATAPTTGTGVWSGTLPAGATISDVNNRTATVTLPAGQTVTLTWTVANGPCAVSTDEVVLTNLLPLANNTIAASQSICTGTTPAELTGSTPTGGNGTYAYQWQSSTTGTPASFTDIPGATGINYTPGALSATTYFRRVVTSGQCSAPGNVVTITTVAYPAFTMESPIDACNASGKFEVKYVVSAGNPVRYDLIALDTKLPGFVDIIDGVLPSSPLTINYPPTTPAGVYSFRIVMRNATGCATQQDFTVTLESLSVPAWIEFNPTRVCEGQQVTMTAKGGNLGSNAEWVWYLGDCGTGTRLGTGGSLTYTLTETTTFSVRAESNRACKNSDCASATITVDKMPAAPDAGPDQDHCNDANFTLAGSTPSIATATGTWSWTGTLPAGASISNVNDPAATVVLPAGNSLTLTWTITNGTCTTVGDQVTLINRLPITNNIISAPQSVCPGNAPTAALTGTAPAGGNGSYTYQWQSSTSNDPATFANISGATGATYLPGALTTTTYYRRVVTSGVCSAPSNIIAITVSVTPVFTVNNVAAICNTVTSFNVVYNATAGTATRYDLRATTPNSMAGFANIVNAVLPASPLTVNLPASVAAGTYNFTLTLRDAVGCESTQPFTVTVEVPSTTPTVPNSSVNICKGASTTLTVNGTLGTGAVWVWYTGGCTGGTEVGRGASISVTPAATTTYYVKAESAGPCGNTTCATVTVNVFELPSAAAAGPDQEHCNVAAFTLNATAPAVGTGVWSGTLPAGATISNVNDRNAIVNLPAGQTVTLTWTVSNGPCAATTDQVTLRNLVALTSNTISAAQTICPNTAPAALTGTAPAGGNGTYAYQWQSSASSDPATFTDISGATNAGYAPGALTTTTYYRRIVTSGACSAPSNIIAITVSVTPVFTVSNVAAICNTVSSFSVSYAVTAGTPVRYDLTASGANVMMGFSNITNAVLTASPLTVTLPAGVAEGVYNFTLTLRDATGCESTMPFTVTVDVPSTPPTVANNSIDICRGASTTLTVNGTLGTGAQWVWYTGGCTGGTEVGRGATINVSPTVTTTYYVKAESTGPCGNTTCATVTVNVFEAPSAAAAGPDQEHCNVAAFTLNATAPAVGTGVWSGTLPAGATISNVSDRNATVNLPAGQTVTLTWTVTNGPCAATTDQVTLTNLVLLSNNTVSAAQSICPNTTPAPLTGTTPAGGNGTYAYQWQSSTTGAPASFTDIPGASGINYAPGALTATTYYRRVVTSGQCSDISNIIAITVSVTPVFTVNNVAAICNTVSSFNVTYNVTAGIPVAYDLKAEGANTVASFTNIVDAALTASPLTVNLPANIPAGTYNFTLTLRDATGCESTMPFTVIIDMPSTPPTVDDDEFDICRGETTTLKVNGTLGTGAQWVWYTGGCTGGTEVGRGATINVTPTATTTYYVKAESSSPCGNTTCVSITVNVFEHPSAAVAGADQEHCNDEVFNLGATAPAVGTGKWSGTLPAGATISSWDLRDAIVTLPAGQTVTLTWTVSNGPCAVTTDEVTLRNLVAISNNIISADQAICPNTAPADLTGTTPAGGNGTYAYQWQSSATNDPATFTNIGGATGAGYAPGNLSATTYYRRVVTSGACSDISNVITITVSVTPAFTVNDVAAICNTAAAFNVVYNVTAGLPVKYDLAAVGPNAMAGFTNITDATLTASPLAISLPANTAAGTYNFTLTLTDAVGCESTGNFTVVIETPSTTPTVDDDQLDICLGETTTLKVNGTLGTGAQWVWYTGGCTGGTEVGRGATINVTPSTTTTYYVKAESTGPCGNTTCVTITVNVFEHPSAAAAGADQEHCNDAAFTLNATAPAIGTGEWSGALPAGATISNVSDRNATVNLPAGQTVTLTWTVSNGPCAVTTDQVTLTNLVALTNNVISADQAICPNTAPATLTGTTPAGGNGTYAYQWQSSTSNDPATFTNIGGATGATYAPGNLAATTYYRRVVSSGTCSDISNIITVTVSVTPVFTVGNVAAICNTAASFNVTYNVTAGTPVQYTLTATGANVMPGFTVINGAALTASPLVISLPANTAAGTYNFTLTLTDAVGCESTQPFTVTIDVPSTTPTVADDEIDICIGQTTTLTVNGTLGTGAQWVWYTGGCTGGTEVGRGASINVTPSTTTTYYVRAESTGPCGNTACATIKVNVFEMPSAAAAGPDQDACDNAAFTLNATAPTVGTGKWSGILPAGATISDVNDRNATLNLPAGETVVLTWTVTNGPCATTSDDVRLTNRKPVANNTITADQVICPDADVAALNGSTPIDGNGAYTYQWQISTTSATAGFSDIPAATGIHYDHGAVSVTTWFRRVVTSGPCTSISNAVQIRVTTAVPVVATKGNDKTVECENGKDYTTLFDEPTFTHPDGFRIDVTHADVTVTNPCGLTITRTWTAEDECGKTTTVSQTIEVKDTKAPVFNGALPADATVECSSIPAREVLTASDDCSAATVTPTQTIEAIPGACANNYKIIRVWTATDVCGNTIRHTQTLTVQDKTAPVFSAPAPANVTVECDAIPGFDDITATDNCTNAATITYGKKEVRTDGNCANNYTLTRTWTAKDECGNEVSISQVITVTDTKAPVFTAPTPANITVECSAIPAQENLTATDACSPADKVTVLKGETRHAIPGACANNYLLVRTWTAMDECKNSFTITQTITVVDRTPPVFTTTTPADVTVECDAVPAAANMQATDLCSPADKVKVEYKEDRVNTPGACANNYQLVRTWTAIDECENKTIITQTITVRDTKAPVFTTAAPANVTVECHMVPAQPDLAATDNCSAANNVSITKNEQRVDGNCANNYQLIRTWTARDECGNETVLTQTITVTDNTKPVFTTTIPADATVDCNSIPAAPVVEASDNCSAPAAIRIVYNEQRIDIPGACANNYKLLRTWTATDECGNATTAMQVITVVDRTAPVFTSAAPADVTVECSAIPAQPDLAATDNCSAVNSIRLAKNEVRENIPGACVNNYRLIRTWTATDECGNVAELKQVITVQDKTAPVFTLPVPADVTVECNAIPAQAVLTATDNCTAAANVRIDRAERKEQLPGATCANNYRLVRTWTATDECGNSTTLTQVITVVDNTAPTFTMPVPADVTVECNAIPAQPMLTATDNCSATNMVTIVRNEVKETIPGACVNNYRLRRSWTATDECGNKTTVEQLITVVDNTRPTFTGSTPADATVECSAIPAQPNLSVTDNCTPSNLVTVVKNERREDIPGACVNNYRLIRTWTATDQCGNSTTVQQVLTVVDRTAPSFVTAAPANATVECSNIPVQPDVMATDNCSGNNVTIVKAERRENIAGACANNYRLIRTWTATDQCGNSKTIEQVLTVVDNTKPVFTTAAPANITVECSAIPAQPDLTATDNCSAANTIRIVKNETREAITGACANNYRLIRTWTATDECGNSTTVQQVITVQDKTAPVFTMLPPANITAQCDAVPAAPVMTATDNCSMNNVTIDFRQIKSFLSATCPNNYRLERIWTAKDEYGNTAVARQIITVTDDTAPVFTTPAPADITVECKAIPAPAAMRAIDNCDRENNVTVKHEVKREAIPGACMNNYRLINIWTATDKCGNAAVIRQVITVIDTTRPVIAAPPADITISCGATVPTNMIELEATDNCDISFPKRVKYTIDPYVKDLCNGYVITRRWKVTDACGNAANDVTQRIIVRPCPKPELIPDAAVNCSSNPFLVLKTRGTVNRPTYTLVSVTPANAVQVPVTSSNPRFNLNGATSATFIVRDGITGCASEPVTYNLNYLQMPVVNLGNDTSLCGGNGMVLDAGPANFGYTIRWSTGETTQRIRVTQAGTYSVTVSNGMCTATDEIKVGVIPMPLVNLPDMTICRGQSAKLDATVTGATYLWSTGATTPSINVSTQETFWVRVMKNGCITIDTINVTVNPPPDITLSRDTSICPGQSVTLTVNTNAGRIQWGNGETGNSIVVSRAGNYSVSVYRDNCVVKEQVRVTQRPDIRFELGPDRIICPGGSILVDARHPDAASYRWNDGDLNPVKSFTESGTYVLGILDKYCDRYKSDSIRVKVAGPPSVTLGSDTTICKGIRYILKAKAENATSYRWSTGATTSYIEVREPGTYSVTAYNDCGSSTDEITISVRECDSKPEMPNAFSPNGDGKNDRFRPIVRGPMYDYELRIFNRWGELVYMSRDMYEGWDGNYKGQPVDVGTFVWWLTYKKTNNGPSFIIKGDVTVVR